MSNSLHFFKRMVFAIACIIPLSVFAQTIEITTEAQLRLMSDDLSADYKLMNDITLTSDWTPIGDETNRFSGTFDGNGKTIYGLKVDLSSTNGVGFIGVSEGAIVENLRLSNAYIQGGQDVGGIIGKAYAPTTVEKCYTSGVIIGYDHIGGVIGGTKSSGSAGDYSSINNCFSTALVKSTSWQAGGIIGTTVDINVSNTYFAGVAVCTSGRTAGIAALADGGSTIIEKSVSIAPYLKGDETNRVFGNANGYTVTLANNYSWDSTKVYVQGSLYDGGVSDAAGVDGEHTAIATLKAASFYTTTLGWSSSVWNVVDGKFPILVGQTYPLNGDAIYFDNFPERAMPGATHATNVVSALGRTVSCTSSNSSVATINSNGLVTFVANGTTTLTFSTTGDDYSAGVTKTYALTVQDISYNITTEQDLKNIKFDLGGTFTLMNNITLTEPWTPIGTFTGTLNGNGKVIYGLTVDERSTRNRGLFSETEGAVITKLGIEQAHVVGNEDVGAIVGNMKGGQIDQCYVLDSYIAGRDHVGSLVGAIRGYDFVVTPADPDNGTAAVTEKRYATVSNSYSGAEVYSREFQAAGIVGIICGGTVEKCYFSGKVESVKGRAAGIVSLVDSNDPGEIKNNINLAVSGYCSENTYRIADWGGHAPEGDSYSVVFTNNWSKETSYFGTGESNSATQTGMVTDRNGANLSNDNNARTQSFYTGTLGWDFTNTWKFIAGTEGKIYPVLAWQSAPLVSKIYGIPASPYLLWYPNSTDAIDLKKIIPTTGQTLNFSILSGSNLVDLDGTWLYVTESNLTQGGIAEIGMGMDVSLASVLNVDKTQFDVDVTLRDAFNDISTAAEFLAINNKLFAKFRLTNNINLSEVDFPGIGSLSNPFTGVIDGNGYVVRGAVVNTGGENAKGLFNATDGATIKQLGVENISFTGLTTSKGDNIGGLVGSCKNTTIEECYVTGVITGNDHVGGFVGGNSNNVEIKNSYADVSISAGQQVGGFFGVTVGSIKIENSYYTGNIGTTSRGWAGGVIGLIDASGNIEISGVASIGNISSVEVAGYHIGGNMTDNSVPRGTIVKFVNNLYNVDATINTNGNQWVLPTTVVGVTEEATPKLPENLKMQATYTAIGWNFTDVWTIEEGTAYPTLKNVGKKSGTSVPETKADNNSNYRIYSNNETIFVSGIVNQANVTVYSVSGQLISQSVVSNNEGIRVPVKGLYIVRITENGNTSTVKVLNK